MQDSIVQALQGGLAPEWVLDLTLPSFDSLMGSLTRLTYRTRAEQAVTDLVAAQGTSKAMKEHLKELSKLARHGKKTGAGVGNAKEFQTLWAQAHRGGK